MMGQIQYSEKYDEFTSTRALVSASFSLRVHHHVSSKYPPKGTSFGLKAGQTTQVGDLMKLSSKQFISTIWDSLNVPFTNGEDSKILIRLGGNMVVLGCRCYLLTDIGKHNINTELKPLVDAKIKQVLGVDDFDLEGVLPEGFLERVLPGLQRLGKKDDSRETFDESAITRPSISEAWEVREKPKIEKPLMNWRFPALENEIDMKDNLKWWAYTVASAIR